MASITKDTHTPPKSKFWIACFNSVGKDGKLARLKRSTKTTDKKEAQRIADEWEKLGQLARAKRLVESQARKVVAEMYQRATGKPLRFHTARSWLTKWAGDKKPDVSARTAMKYGQFTREFIEYLGKKADAPLNEIIDEDMTGFLRSLKASGHSRTTVNNNLKVLRMAFRLAHRKGYIEADPCADVKADKEDALLDSGMPVRFAARLSALSDGDASPARTKHLSEP